MQYDITRSCGHRTHENLFGKHADRENRLAWLKTQPCMECKRAAERTAATAANAAAGLPTLTGSEKQVAWAETIRAEQLGRIDAIIADADRRVAAGQATGTPDEIADGMAHLRGQRAAVAAMAAASWWIDHRHAASRVLVADAQRIAAGLPMPTVAEQRATESALVRRIAAEGRR